MEAVKRPKRARTLTCPAWLLSIVPDPVAAQAMTPCSSSSSSSSPIGSYYYYFVYFPSLSRVRKTGFPRRRCQWRRLRRLRARARYTRFVHPQTKSRVSPDVPRKILWPFLSWRCLARTQFADKNSLNSRGKMIQSLFVSDSLLKTEG